MSKMEKVYITVPFVIILFVTIPLEVDFRNTLLFPVLVAMDCIIIFSIYNIWES